MMKVVIGLLCCLMSDIVFSEDAAQQLQTKLNAMHAMSASFTQVVKAKERTVATSSGTMALQRPGLFRWDTRDPLKQLIVADGKKLWIYDPDLEQVTVKTQEKGLGGTAALFLSGYDERVSNDFNVVEKTKGTNHIYSLTAKSPRESFRRIELVYQGEQLTGMQLFDQLGQTTRVTFKQVRYNPTLKKSLFAFKPPKGTDVVKQ